MKGEMRRLERGFSLTLAFGLVGHAIAFAEGRLPADGEHILGASSRCWRGTGCYGNVGDGRGAAGYRDPTMRRVGVWNDDPIVRRMRSVATLDGVFGADRQ